MAKSKKQIELEQQIGELTLDLQRQRADFENYRKRVDIEKQSAREAGEVRAISRLLPVIDTIDRATMHIPKEIADNTWVKGVAGLSKQLDKSLSELKLSKIDSSVGVEFNPDVHQAIQFDEESVGDKEVVTEELQPGYSLGGKPIRHAMVRVARK
ncbi:MAG: nucleotide exchange factor GrpE [Candidatus Saccharimonas sp.]